MRRELRELDPEFRGTFRGDSRFSNIRLGPILVALAVVAVGAWFVFGGPAYTVAPDEQGVVLTFGRYSSSSEPGFHLKWPWPIQSVETPKVAELKRIELGFRSYVNGGVTNYRTFLDTPELRSESQMLTGDENVVDCSLAVQYRIKHALEYLFNFRPGENESTLRAVAESALRQAVGDHPIDDVLTTGKVEVQNEVRDKMQELADAYGMGVTIVAVQLQDVQPPAEVAPAFRDVATAREEREKIINEAQAYAREALPKAEGEAARITQEAQGYKEARVAEAQGEIARFAAIAKEYEAAPEITRTRLYLEMMSEVLANMKITVVDENTGVSNLRVLSEPEAVLAGRQAPPGVQAPAQPQQSYPPAPAPAPAVPFGRVQGRRGQ